MSVNAQRSQERFAKRIVEERKDLLMPRKIKVFITADQKVFNEENNSRLRQRSSAVVQDLATQWIQSYPRKSCEDSNRSMKIRQQNIRMIRCNLLRHVKIYSGIMKFNPHTDPNRAALLKEQYAE